MGVTPTEQANLPPCAPTGVGLIAGASPDAHGSLAGDTIHNPRGAYNLCRAS